ncbi:MAG: hypothetical protein AAGA90_23290 [Actinomycetota bacterium]
MARHRVVVEFESSDPEVVAAVGDLIADGVLPYGEQVGVDMYVIAETLSED